MQIIPDPQTLADSVNNTTALHILYCICRYRKRPRIVRKRFISVARESKKVSIVFMKCYISYSSIPHHRKLYRLTQGPGNNIFPPTLKSLSPPPASRNTHHFLPLFWPIFICLTYRYIASFFRCFPFHSANAPPPPHPFFLSHRGIGGEGV
jgi:hypothetical protein